MNPIRIEILKNTGDNQYNDVIYLKTITSNVLSKSNITLEEELFNIKSIMNNSSILSTTNYIVTVDNVIELTINNPNYVKLDSELEVYYNGLLLIENYHYSILGTDKIKLLDFTASVNDEFVFKVYNKNKPNIDLSYKSLPQESQEAIEQLTKSINNYVYTVNDFKKTLVTQLNNIKVSVSIEDSFDTIAEKIDENLNKKNSFPTDLGVLIGKPYYQYDVFFSLGSLYGEKNTVSYHDNDLGNLF